MSEKELSLGELRREYRLKALGKQQIDPNPFLQFTCWFEEALSAAVSDPNAMVLSTADPMGRPSSRIVLLKSYDQRGFVFFTNYRSRKARDLERNPQATLLFFWSELERQIRIDGKVQKISPQESDDYFQTRPFGSQISAWASPQSDPVSNREELDERFKKTLERFRGQEVPRPPFWGGYCLMPDCLEFWQGRSERLHDRIQYRIAGDSRWIVERLCP